MVLRTTFEDCWLTSIWSRDSEISPFTGAASSSITESRLPALSRRTRRMGWISKCTVSALPTPAPICWRLRPALTESTRKGMLSLTISMIVWVDCQPWSSWRGL